MGCQKENNTDENGYHMEAKISMKINTFAYEYKVQCKIGEGSFSEVLKCIDRHSGVAIAAKQLKKSFKSAAHAYETPELVAMRKLTRHPNILHMIESHFDQLTGKVTLVFELMDMSLYDLVKNRKKPIPENKAKNFLYQIVKGVDHIHHHGIFHRDIKPENILVKGDILKISDLGSIKGIYTRHPYTEYISTRWYRSPECLLTSGFYGPKMDVWAIGCVFYELLTLKPLFPGSNELDQIAKINSVLGTPSNRLLERFKKHKGRNNDIHFSPKQGTGLNPLIPFISEHGRDILRQMIVYDPDARSNIRRLIEHKYFLEFRQHALSQKYSVSSIQGVPKTTWRNPVLLSYLTSGRKKKLKNDKSVLVKCDDVSPPSSETSSKVSVLETNARLGGPDGMIERIPVKTLYQQTKIAEPQLAKQSIYLGISNPGLEKLKERLKVQRQKCEVIMNAASNGESKSHMSLPDRGSKKMDKPVCLKSTSFLPHINEKGMRKDGRSLLTTTKKVSDASIVLRSLRLANIHQ